MNVVVLMCAANSANLILFDLFTRTEYFVYDILQGEHSLSLITNIYYKKTTWNTNITTVT
jgi:hypothetical protein